MDRRKFLALTGTTAALAGCRQADALRPGAESDENRLNNKPVKMQVGTQRSPTSPRMLQYIKRHGINNICGFPPKPNESYVLFGFATYTSSMSPPDR